jgi:5'-nucleotidase
MVIGGHDQILFNPYRQVGDVSVFQAFEKGKYLGRVDLSIEKRENKAKILQWDYLPITSHIKEDPCVAAIVDKYQRRLSAQFKEVIGESSVFLYGERDKIRYQETNLGNFVTDIMRQATQADIALLNAGSLRASLDEGPITIEEVFKVMPYANELQVVKVPGDVIWDIFKRAVRSLQGDEDGGFLHVSGLHITIRHQLPQSITHQGQPLISDKLYDVVITDFMSSGGDGYSMFKGLEIQSTGLPLRELIIDAIRTRKIITASVDNRLIRLD